MKFSRAKRMEYNLNHRWGRMMSIEKSVQDILPEMKQVLPLASLIAAEMSFFVNQLQYYINFEILECSWAILEDKLHNSKDLDELIAAHSEFLQTLYDGCFLSDRLWNNLKALRSIFDQIVRFEVSLVSGTRISIEKSVFWVKIRLFGKLLFQKYFRRRYIGSFWMMVKRNATDENVFSRGK